MMKQQNIRVLDALGLLGAVVAIAAGLIYFWDMTGIVGRIFLGFLGFTILVMVFWRFKHNTKVPLAFGSSPFRADRRVQRSAIGSSWVGTLRTTPIDLRVKHEFEKAQY